MRIELHDGELRRVEMVTALRDTRAHSIHRTAVGRDLTFGTHVSKLETHRPRGVGLDMRVIAWKTLRRFAEKHPRALVPLKVWCKLMESSEFADPADLKRLFGLNVDFLPHNVVIFDVGGNKYRISVSIRYRLNMVFIRDVMTHAEYDRQSRRDSL